MYTQSAEFKRIFANERSAEESGFVVKVFRSRPLLFSSTLLRTAPVAVPACRVDVVEVGGVVYMQIRVHNFTYPFIKVTTARTGRSYNSTVQAISRATV